MRDFVTPIRAPVVIGVPQKQKRIEETIHDPSIHAIDLYTILVHCCRKSV
jgi:hypothetical protein